MDISNLREEYTQAGLNREDLNENPFRQFELWFKQAQDAQLPEPNACSLATASADGVPSLRTVLLKYFDDTGFVFSLITKATRLRKSTRTPRLQ